MASNQPWWLTWPVAEVAATILPLFSSSARASEIRAMGTIVNWWKTGAVHPPSWIKASWMTPFEDADFRAAAEAMHAFELAGLLYAYVSRRGWLLYRIDPTGDARASNQHRA
jgi:hypothetical protein